MIIRIIRLHVLRLVTFLLKRLRRKILRILEDSFGFYCILSDAVALFRILYVSGWFSGVL